MSGSHSPAAQVALPASSGRPKTGKQPPRGRDNPWPRPTEVAIGAVLLALIAGTLVMPTVIVEPYDDVLAAESVDALHARLTDPAIAPTHAERALAAIAKKAGDAIAVNKALGVLRLPGVTADSPLANVSLGFLAAHPVASCAGDVLRAWIDGRIPDRYWRERMRASWAPVCGWFVVPLGQQLGHDDRRLMFVFDVLALDAGNMYSVPDAASTTGRRRLNGPDILVRRVVAWYGATPGNVANLPIEERILVNLADLPADVSGNESARSALRDTFQAVVTARRLPTAVSAAEQDGYVRAMLDTLKPLVPDDEWAAYLGTVVQDSAEPDAWTRVGKAMLAGSQN